MKKIMSCRYDCKLFSNEMLFSTSGIPRRRSELEFARVMPLSAVLLMNSPSLGDWEWKEYARLCAAYRSGRRSSTEPRPSRMSESTTAEPDEMPIPCYFICADGAYSALRRRWEAQKGASHCDGSESLVLQQMPDVVIGDMDSCEPDDLPFEAKAVEKKTNALQSDNDLKASRTDKRDPNTDVNLTRALPGYLHFYPTVADIPMEVLAAIRERSISRISSETHGDRSSVGVQPPFFFRIGCQMTTDFQKVMLLVERLEQAFPLDFPRFRRDSSSAETAPFIHVADDGVLARQVQQTYLQVRQDLIRTMEDRVAGAWVEGVAEEGLQKERSRVVALLHALTGGTGAERATHSAATHDTEASTSTGSEKVVTHLLPNVAVYGAIGGRFDHEMGVMSCVLEYAERYHVMVTNPHNIIMACWPDGLTQWVTYNELHPDVVLQRSGADAETTNPPITKHEGKTEKHCEKSGGCGVIPMGTVKELETTGFLYNIVKGRPSTFDGVTQTSGYRFAFGGLLSACNIVNDCIVTVDLRPTRQLDQSCVCGAENPLPRTFSPEGDTYNPPTLLTCSRQ